MTAINVCLRVAGHHAANVVNAAVACEQLGFGGVSISDELSDVEEQRTWSHEPWTLLSAIAAVTERVELAPMVLNVANRDAGTTAVAAATLQQLSGGRLILGLGAGTDRTSIYARDQLAFGRIPPRAPQRREALRAHIAGIRAVWDNTTDGFLRPDPLPPIVIGAFGPRTAELTGQVADGIACPLEGFGDHAQSLESLVAIARDAFDAAGRTGTFEVIAHTGPTDTADDPLWHRGSQVYDRIAAAGADRLVLFLDPDLALIERVAKVLPVG